MATDPIITDDTPLRLAVAAETAFPGGGMTASGLRKEAVKGRLVIERVAGKDFTTLRAIADMRKLCRVAPARSIKSQHVDNIEPESRDATQRALYKFEISSNGPVDIKDRLCSHWADVDKKNKARPMGKRERDALRECFDARGTSITLERHWPRTALWLALHGLVKTDGLDRNANRRYSIAPAGEAEWQRIQMMNKRAHPEGCCNVCGGVTRTMGAIGQRCMRPMLPGKPRCEGAYEARLNADGWRECPACDAVGFLDGEICTSCNAEGWFPLRLER